MLIDVDKEKFNKNKLTFLFPYLRKFFKGKLTPIKKFAEPKEAFTVSRCHLFIFYYVLHYLIFYDKCTLSSASPHSPCAHAIHHKFLFFSEREISRKMTLGLHYANELLERYEWTTAEVTQFAYVPRVTENQSPR